MNETDEMAALVRFRATATEPAGDVLRRACARLVAAVENQPAPTGSPDGSPDGLPVGSAHGSPTGFPVWRRFGLLVVTAAGLAAVRTGVVVAVDTVTHGGRPVTGASAAAL